jgi:hypothetical protein
MFSEKSEDLGSSISQKQFDFPSEGWGTSCNSMHDISRFVIWDAADNFLLFNTLLGSTLLILFSTPLNSKIKGK